MLLLSYIERVDVYSDKNENVFRFYFTSEDKIDDVVGEGWSTICSNQVVRPYKKYIESTYIIENRRLDMELLTENDYYTYNDGADGIIALAWEYSENETPNKRLVFQFGDTLENVENKLYNKEILLKKEKLKFEE
jgi:hypothetical protein